ncbi:T9SS type A sorting domain-containing protein, partial [Winogradskyella vincentii]
RYIPVGQGFFVVGENSGTINFNNGQRVFQKEGGASSVFVRNMTAQNSGDNQASDERMKFRIGFNSVNTIHRQLLLTIDENTTEGVDWAYDAVLNEEQVDDMYWRIDDGNYTIQGYNEIIDETVLPLGLHTSTEGNNEITIDALENVPDDLNIYLHDKVLDIYHDLRASSYQINLDAGAYLDRFEIAFSLPQSLSIDDSIENGIYLYYAFNRNTIVILNPNQLNLQHLEIFDITGKKVYNIEARKESYSEYLLKQLSQGVYVIQLHHDGGIETKKFIVD